MEQVVPVIPFALSHRAGVPESDGKMGYATAKLFESYSLRNSTTLGFYIVGGVWRGVTGTFT